MARSHQTQPMAAATSSWPAAATDNLFLIIFGAHMHFWQGNFWNRHIRIYLLLAARPADYRLQLLLT